MKIITFIIFPSAKVLLVCDANKNYTMYNIQCKFANLTIKSNQIHKNNNQYLFDYSQSIEL